MMAGFMLLMVETRNSSRRVIYNNFSNITSAQVVNFLTVYDGWPKGVQNRHLGSSVDVFFFTYLMEGVQSISIGPEKNVKDVCFHQFSPKSADST